MRRQRPFRYTLAFLTAAAGVAATPAARAVASDDTTTEGTLPADASTAPASPEPAEEPQPDTEPEPENDPAPAPEPEPTTPSTTEPERTETPATDPKPTSPPTTEPAAAPAAEADVVPAPDGPAAQSESDAPTSESPVDTTSPAPDELDEPTVVEGIDGITRPIAFPVLGTVSYSNDWGACRDGCARHHQGTDLLGARMQPLLAAVDGTVTRVRYENVGTAGAVISITGDDGWYYNYFHLNDDTPGTDDGLGTHEWQISPGLTVGSQVRAGQVIGYMGDSGNAEWSVPHLHFEIRTPDRTPVNPYHSLVAAQERETCATGASAWTNYALESLSPSAVAVIPLSGGGRWVIDSDGRLYAEGPAARIDPARGVDCDAVQPLALVTPSPTMPAATTAAPTPQDVVPAPEVAVPADVAVPVAVAVPAPSPTADRWTVAPGECLWDIVQTAYGTSDTAATVSLVDLVFNHNRDQLTDPNLLEIGTVLELPPLVF